MIRIAGLAALCCTLFLFVSLSGARISQSQTTRGLPDNALSSAEQDLLNEINQARAHPDVYASYLEKLKPLFHDKEYVPSGQDGFKTEEGWSAVEDAISFLRAAKPQGPLSPSNGLRLAALAHCMAQGKSGTTGHSGGGGFVEERVKPFGTWQGGIGENLTYGDESARERVLLWLIDDGFATRGHRKRLLSADYKVAGVACAVHLEFRKMCVLDLAGGFIDSSANKAAQTKPTAVANDQTSNTKRLTKTRKSKTSTLR
jgi:uncharacterized protein YkwD